MLFGLQIAGGEQGDDILLGGSDNDILVGGDGNDALNGNAGVDLLQGGAGNDIYLFGTEPQEAGTVGAGDVIADTQGADVIRIEGALGLASVTARQGRDGAITLYWGGGSVRVNGGEDVGTRFKVDLGAQGVHDLGGFLASPLPDPSEVDAASPQANAQFIARHKAIARRSIADANRAGALDFHPNYASYHAQYMEPGADFAGWGFTRIPDAAPTTPDGFTPILSDAEFVDVSKWTAQYSPDGGPGTVSMAPIALDGQLGAAANTLIYSAGLVDAGEGDDTLVANMQGFSRESWRNYAVDGYGFQTLHHPYVLNGELKAGLTLRNELLLTGEAVATWMNGGGGDDTLVGSEVADVLYGGSGFNVLSGRAGPDRYLVTEREAADPGYDYIVEHDTSRPYLADSSTPYGGIVSDIIPPGADIDTVEFGPGIRLADLSFTVQRPSTDAQYVAPGTGQGVRLQPGYEEPLERFVALEEPDLAYLIVERNGRRLAAVELTRHDLEAAGLPGSDSSYWDELSNFGYDEADAPDSGIEYFAFQDGKKISMAEALALAVSPASFNGPVVARPLRDAVAQEDTAFSYAVAADAFADGNSGALELTARLSDGNPLPSWLHFGQATVAGASAWALSGTPENADVGLLRIRVSATNVAGQSVSDEFALAVENVNDAPTVANSLQPQAVSENTSWVFVIPADTFADVDAGDVLTYSAKWSDGSSLPSWITFNPATRTLTGTPPAEAVKANRAVFGPSVPAVAHPAIVVTATDIAGASVSTALTLDITPAAANLGSGMEKLTIVNEPSSIDLYAPNMVQAMSSFAPPAAWQPQPSWRFVARETMATTLTTNWH